MYKVKIHYAIQEIRISEIEVSEKELEILITSKVLSKGFQDDRMIMEKLEKNKSAAIQHNFFELQDVEIEKSKI